MSALLTVRGLVKRFGGLLATDHVDLDIAAGELHALIGPNGAGKTTLVGQLGGQLAPDEGRVHLGGEDITALPPHRRARRGLARSFQITRLFAGLTVHEHLALALQALDGSSLGAWRPVARERRLFEQADAMLPGLTLDGLGERRVDALSHGERRMLEVGLALSGTPRLVLLDEPMAGLGGEESARMEALVSGLRGRTAVLLIEHDVDAVFRLADRVSVLVDGRVIASGPPAAVRLDAGVVAAYLGDGVSG